MPRKAPGVKDVAALAGVSVGSVSNVINRRDSVRPDVRERAEKTRLSNALRGVFEADLVY